ncbi:MAG TPA: TonB C-terminal domain-containing protein [Polyangia bacterium]
MRPGWARFAFLSLAAHVALAGALAAIHPRVASSPPPVSRPTEIALYRPVPSVPRAVAPEPSAPPAQVASLERRRRAEPIERAVQERTTERRVNPSPTPPKGASATAIGIERSIAPPSRIDLFSPRALDGIVRPSASTFGGTTRRLGDGLPPPGTRDVAADREEAAARVDDLVGRLVGHERVESGAVRPRWRDAERRLTETFRPPLALVKQESVGKMFVHQLLRELREGPPPAGKVARAVDASRLNVLGVSDGTNLPSLPQEQQQAMQAAMGRPASWLSTEVEAVIDGAGKIVSLRVVVPSGRRKYDRAVLEAVKQAIKDRGALDEPGPVVTLWAVDASVSVAPPTGVGFTFDESGRLQPGATGVRKYLRFNYPMQQTVKTRVKLLAAYHRR